jgi:hypothetical protein
MNIAIDNVKSIIKATGEIVKFQPVNNLKKKTSFTNYAYS